MTEPCGMRGGSAGSHRCGGSPPRGEFPVRAPANWFYGSTSILGFRATPLSAASNTVRLNEIERGRRSELFGDTSSHADVYRRNSSPAESQDGLTKRFAADPTGPRRAFVRRRLALWRAVRDPHVAPPGRVVRTLDRSMVLGTERGGLS